MKIWDKIVILHPEGRNNKTLKISDSREAARILLNSWPAVQGKSYRRAVLSCSAAVDDRVPQDTAQWAFIVAVMEAAIPYEIIDRLDAEIGAVCRELLEDEAPVCKAGKLAESNAQSPLFWWPKRSGQQEHQAHAFPEAAGS